MLITEKINWGEWTSLDVTNLNSLSGGDRWGSVKISDADPSHPRNSHDFVEVWYELTAGANFVAADSLRFGLAKGDNESSETFVAGLSSAQAQITTAAAVERLDQAISYQTHFGSANHSTGVSGSKVFSSPGPSFKVIIGVESNSLAASGNTVKYRFGTRQASN